MLLLVIIILALFALFLKNNRNNDQKFANRKGRNFRENYKIKKQERKDETELNSF
jgi:Tfp pilus assembly protein PilV